MSYPGTVLEKVSMTRTSASRGTLTIDQHSNALWHTVARDPVVVLTDDPVILALLVRSERIGWISLTLRVTPVLGISTS